MITETNKNGYDMIYLAACAVQKEPPDTERVRTMDLPAVYQMAKFHALQSITYTGLELWIAAVPENETVIFPELNKKWAEAKSKAIRKNILFETEREKLFRFLDEQGIWYMPLKGVLLQDFYPEYGMRQMVDNDILFDGCCRETVRKYFLENGYTENEKEDESHDVYTKHPVYNFEMHFALHRQSSDTLFYEYYKNVKERLRNHKSAHLMEYRFENEDFYIYLLSHSYKHFIAAGIGIRSLLDIYVYLSALEKQLDWRYIESECEKLGMKLYERSARFLAKKLFQTRGIKEEDLTEEERALAAYYIASGSHGTAENRIIQKIRASEKNGQSPSFFGKMRYLLRRTFPDMNYIQEHYPFFFRHRVLLPFLPFWRCLRLLIRRPKDLLTELKLVWTTRK